jgi:ABC-type Mn2+/Zn2+ transport system permease subunit
MPVPLRAKAVAKTAVKRGSAPSAPQWTTDQMGIWAICLGAVATALALFICFAGRAPVAASFILAFAATIIALFLHQTTQEPDRG